MLKVLLGEALGTFALVLIGCGTVAFSVLFGWPEHLLSIALLWGLGVYIGISIGRAFGSAHLNPAVTLAFTLNGNTSWKHLPLLMLAQFIGAILAGIVLFLGFKSEFLSQNIDQPVMFGEFFPNPGQNTWQAISWPMACLTEAIGTFILMITLFKISHNKQILKAKDIILIALTVSGIICLIAPFTQAGINPARDFGPRLVADIAHWGKAAYSGSIFESIMVYVVGPFLGATAAFLLKKITFNHQTV